MASVRTAGFVAICALGLGMVAVSPARAASTAGPAGNAGWVKSSVAGCPYILWRIARDPNGQLHGIAYYSDLSGLSTVTGTRDANGDFELNVVPTSVGAGPSGKVTGHMGADGAMKATLVGKGCANATADVPAVSDLNMFPTGQ